MVRRKALEMLYEGTCSIIGYEKIKRENGSTGFSEVIKHENQPCRLSFEKITGTNMKDGAAQVSQTTKLFISPDVVIDAGSKLVVTQNGITTEYKRSGEPAIYDTHQEIILELFKGWA